MGERLSFEAAQARSKANKSAVVLPREARESPDVWPEITPSFHFGRDAKLFAIGSCFARNIELHLSAAGFDVRSLPSKHGFGFEPGHLNKYSPPSILQELRWAKTILERDDSVRPEDVEPLLCRVGEDVYVDTQLHGFRGTGFAEALQKRREIYQIYREAFSADVVIVTLGLIETWWDDVQKAYVHAPTLPMARQKGRFQFEQLDFASCLEAVRATMRLLDRGDGTPKILLTTSPVPLRRTFTSADVAVANSYSKSVLRAVSGQVQMEFPQVDYFPSYESVTLSRSEGIWLDDMIHVSQTFVARIMERVRMTYVAEDAALNTDLYELVHRFEAASTTDLEAAYALLAQIRPIEAVRMLSFRIRATNVLIERGAHDEIGPYLENLDTLAPTTLMEVGMLQVLELRLARDGHPELAAKIAPYVARFGVMPPPVLTKSVEKLLDHDDRANAQALLEQANIEEIACGPTCGAYVDLCDRLGLTTLGNEVLFQKAARGLMASPERKRLAQRLMEQERLGEALEQALIAAEAEDYAPGYRFLCLTLARRIGDGAQTKRIVGLFAAAAERAGATPADTPTQPGS